jgi:hypothetical protein
MKIQDHGAVIYRYMLLKNVPAENRYVGRYFGGRVSPRTRRSVVRSFGGAKER